MDDQPTIEHRRRIVVALAVVVAIGVVSGCGGQGRAAAKSSPSRWTTATPCSTHRWPAKVPSVVGQNLTNAQMGNLACFDVVSAVGPGGHKVADSTDGTSVWTITKTKPAAGTLVAKTTPVTLYVGSASSGLRHGNPLATRAPRRGSTERTCATVTFRLTAKGVLIDATVRATPVSIVFAAENVADYPMTGDATRDSVTATFRGSVKHRDLLIKGMRSLDHVAASPVNDPADSCSAYKH